MTGGIRWRLLVATVVAAPLCASCERRTVDSGRVLTANLVGTMYLQEGRLAEAETEFRKVVSLAPWTAAGYANLALVYLRLARYDDAQAQLRQAMRRDTTSAELRLWQARLHELTGRSDEAGAELRALLARDSTNLKALYALARLDEAASAGARDTHLRRIVALAPANLAARLELAFRLLRRGQADSAVAQLEALRQIEPEPPREARAAFEEALTALRLERTDQADAALQRYQRFAELSPAYQASLKPLLSPEGPQAGLPALTFSPILQLAGDDTGRAVRDAIRFQDATAAAGLGALGPAPVTTRPGPTARATLAVGDYDGDGAEDLLISARTGGTAAPLAHLFRADSGRFRETTEQAGLSGRTASAAAFGDYDNDGRMDLFLADERGGRILHADERGRFRETVSGLGPGPGRGIRKALFVDFDQDGDLDLALATAETNLLLRNNLDDTFEEVGALAGLDGTAPGRDLAMGDFDDDGLIDLLVGTDSGAALFRNQGMQRFVDVAGANGVTPAPGTAAVAVGDYDNDGYLDLALVARDGEPALYRNRGDGTYTPDQRSQRDFRAAAAIAGMAVAFLDYDNDGRLDLVLAGEPAAPGGRAVLLFANNGDGRFEDQSAVLPEEVPAADAIATTDYDGDGDLDLVLAGAMGARVLRNDGGNANRYVQLRLTALRTGSGKNNTFGIGARVEVSVAGLYQTRVITERVTHFGLGAHPSADALRVIWPNGVPQVLAREVSAAVVEEEILKGSCAFVYAWDGKAYRLVTDMMWRSALGMPLGIMGGNTAYAPPGASLEYLRIPGSQLQPREGRYRLQLTEELWETAYMDEVKLIAVDHPDSVEVYVNERFVPPGPTPLRLYRVARIAPPVAAVDRHGTDKLPQLLARDDRYVDDLTPTRYQGLTRNHELILDLGPESPAGGPLLLLNGWIHPTDASINLALSQSAGIQPQGPALDARRPGGPWRTVLSDLGFPAGKRKTVIADLRGKLRPGEREVRIRTNLQLYWDEALVAAEAPGSPVRMTTLAPSAADLHYRGFSRVHRKGGRYGPHWFDYDQVSREPRWRPIEGLFTRYGDVLPLLTGSDDRYVVMAPGDEVSVEFAAEALPPLPSGWTRNFLLYSDGWIKDSDLNTATGTTVDPLPFHAMSRYPYGAEEHFPADSGAQRYLREYHTRRVGRTRP